MYNVCFLQISVLHLERRKRSNCEFWFRSGQRFPNVILCITLATKHTIRE